ncbi:MAG: hypothetical protein J6D34_01315 [Atopobiaceae bacterium]|nr:hypothetical protein [Atopobiaceae bacterium]
MSNNIIAATGLACILVFGACGCSFSSTSESTSTVETSVTDEEGNTTTTKTTTGSDGTTTTETTESLAIGEWTDAWIGSTEEGYDVYYAQSPDGTQAFLVLHNESKNDIDSFIGNTENPEEDIVTVYGQNEKFTFQVVETGDNLDSLTLWFGDDYGTASMTRCSLDELVAGVREFDAEGNIIEL